MAESTEPQPPDAEAMEQLNARGCLPCRGGTAGGGEDEERPGARGRAAMQDAYETPFDRYETAVDVDEATEHLETRMDRLEARIDRLEVALDRIEVGLDRLERTMRRGMLFVMVGSIGWMALMVYLTRGTVDCRLL